MKKPLLLITLLAPCALFGQSTNDTGAPSFSNFTGFTRAAGTDSFDGSEATMSPRFFRSGTPGNSCSEFSSGNFQYRTYEFFTDNSGSLTVNFDPGTCGSGIFVTFHNTSFNPANICENYVWSHGSSEAFSETFAVTPSQHMVMVVSGVANAPGVVCGPYSYEIIGDALPISIPTLGSLGSLILIGLVAVLGVAFMIRRRKAIA